MDGCLRDVSFQRKTGYAQQQDIHLETMTVREALQFQALMCQKASLDKRDKLAYVEEIIHLLAMETYADAIVGIPGEGKQKIGVNITRILTLSRSKHRATKKVDYCCRTIRETRTSAFP